MNHRQTLSEIRTRLHAVTCCLCVSVFVAHAAFAEDASASNGITLEKPGFLWWEAEAAANHTFPARNAFKANTTQEKDVLSGGTWLQTDKGSNVTATWDINLIESGTYTLWVRKFWRHGPFHWSFNKQPEQLCSRKCTLVDSVGIRKFLCADWVSLGKVTLPQGKNTLKIKALPDATAIAFDCWVLSKEAFAPNGNKKPGEKYNRTEPGWFAFEPDPDPFTDNALLDLRSMNQSHAGVDGYIKADGDHFVFEKTGKAVTFWAANALVFGDHKRADAFARHLAKCGINMIRLHGAIWDMGADDPATINMKYLDNIHYFVATMAKQGIYTKISFFFPLWFKIQEKFNFPGYKKAADKNGSPLRPYGQLYFHPRIQGIYKTWVKAILRTPNPYTGKALADDPALAIMEIINEDSFFFWTFAPYKNPSAECMVVLEKHFGDWVTAKYGSIEKAKKIWGPAKNPKHPDVPNEGRVAFYQNSGFMGSFNWAKQQRNDKRIKDQAEFLVGVQRDFYASMKAHFKQDLGYKGLVSASNWQTVDNNTLGALEKYTYTPCDVIDRHGYFGGTHKGDGASWSVRKGHTYSDRSGLLEPDSLTKEIQYGKHPHIVSEYNYPMPNRFRAEGPFMAATYGLLSGTDGFFHFSIHSHKWLKGNNKFPVHTPVVLGQFPALSVIYRMRLLKEAPTVANVTLSLKDLYALKGTPVAQPQHLDKLRAKDVPPGGVLKVDAPQAIDPLAYYVGKVKIGFSPDTNRSQITDLSPYLNRETKTVKSATGELVCNWDIGLVTVNAPAAQGACGFLQKAGTIKLKNLTLDSKNEYGTVVAVALDGKPLADSEKILLQVMTEDKNYGWKTNGNSTKTITDVGAPPILVREMQGSATLKHTNAAGMEVIALDVNGYPKKRLGSGAKTSITIPFEKDVLYYIIQQGDL